MKLAKRRAVSTGVLGVTIAAAGLIFASPAMAANCDGSADNSNGYVNVANCKSTLTVYYQVNCRSPFEDSRFTQRVYRPNGSLHLKYTPCGFLGVSSVTFHGITN